MSSIIDGCQKRYLQAKCLFEFVKENADGVTIPDVLDHMTKVTQMKSRTVRDYVDKLSSGNGWLGMKIYKERIPDAEYDGAKSKLYSYDRKQRNKNLDPESALELERFSLYYSILKKKTGFLLREDVQSLIDDCVGRNFNQYVFNEDMKLSKKIFSSGSGYIFQGELENHDWEVFENILIALSLDCVIEIEYSEYLVKKSLSPLGIWIRDDLYYLCALDNNDSTKSPRWYKISRIKGCSINRDLKSYRLNGFDISEFAFKNGIWGRINDERIPILELLVIEDVTVKHIRESKLSRHQVISELDNGYKLEAFDVPNTRELLWWVLSMGDNIEVVRPSFFREEIVKTVESISEIYGLN